MNNEQINWSFEWNALPSAIQRNVPLLNNSIKWYNKIVGSCLFLRPKIAQNKKSYKFFRTT